ncbi:hypothetical protein Nocox_27075 [Nonomuraea coxensis DSM 45129]|uniref:Uncharacterized protein n=1 Tax=Nonomuraea coxensis DSM 45129 TaxID=1122611 RepID=A0ABX8U844_9ACTN|nr:hypothetical protein [Nonomuraea coxensis]QYC43014.1 hypothetical protein Nocox_27075 [Nonomuraea coxensis DSM 45129]
MSELPHETGDDRVDAIVAGLGRLGELPVGEHPRIFDEAFSALEATLGAVDDDPARAVHEMARAARRPDEPRAGQAGQGVGFPSRGDR